MFGDEEVQGSIEEGTTTASGVADGNLQEPVAVGLQLFDEGLLGCHLAFFVGEVLAFIDTEFRFLFATELAYGVFNDVLGDVLWCVENAVFLALADGGRFALLELGGNFFDLGQRVLEDMAKDVDIDIALEVVVGNLLTVAHQHLIGDGKAIEDFIRLEEATVVCKDLVVLALKASVHVAEIFLQTIVKRLVLVKVFQLLPLVDDEHDGVGWQQPTVFGEKDE